MIKHLILVNNKNNAKNISDLINAKNGYCFQTIEVGNKKYFEFFLGHNGTINKFSFPLSKENILSVTGNLSNSDIVWPVAPLEGNQRMYLTPVEEFYLPSKTIGDGMISSIKVETEGMIVPGRYGFTLVKLNVPFNERNKYYVEIIVKEDTSYSDFASILNDKFNAIDKNISVVFNIARFEIRNLYNVLDEDKSEYVITLDELASYAFTFSERSEYHNVDSLALEQLRKLAYECDADYGFDYTNTGGENLYKVNREELFNQLSELWADEALTMLSIKVFEPSLYRTLDPRINQSYTFIGSDAVMSSLFDALNTELNGTGKNNNADVHIGV